MVSPGSAAKSGCAAQDHGTGWLPVLVSLIEREPPAVENLGEAEGALKREREGEAAGALRCDNAVGVESLPRDAPEIAVIGDFCGSGVGHDAAAGDGGQTLVPTAGIAGVEGHGECARSDRCKGRLEEFAIAKANGRDFAAELREEGDGAGPGPDENVFFFEFGDTLAQHPFIP